MQVWLVAWTAWLGLRQRLFGLEITKRMRSAVVSALTSREIVVRVR